MLDRLLCLLIDHRLAFYQSRLERPSIRRAYCGRCGTPMKPF
jgi:hypothetical protein